VRDERAQGQREAHIRSMPSISAIRIAKTAIPSTIATTSMDPVSGPARYEFMTIRAQRITIL
jgi:hypothetical protein